MTAPLTPPDCDLRDFAYMPLDAGRVLDSDLFALATGEEFKAAFALWCKSWQQVPAASLANDDRVLAHLSGAGSRWKKVKEMALRGFVLCEDGRLYHPVVAEKANEAWSKKQSYRERSKKGNEKRWGSQKDSDTQSQSDPLAIPKGVLEPPKGEGEGSIPLDKSNGGLDPEKFMFDTGVAMLMAQGRSENSARSALAKWKKAHGAGQVIEMLGAAQRLGAVDIPSFAEARWRSNGNSQPTVPL